MLFLVDAQLPPALVDLLQQPGHYAEHVNAIGLGGAPDHQLWARATQRGSVILTKDQDFADLVRRSVSGPAVVWIRLGNTTRNALWRELEPILPEILGALERGERLIEVR